MKPLIEGMLFGVGFATTYFALDTLYRATLVVLQDKYEKRRQRKLDVERLKAITEENLAKMEVYHSGAQFKP